jgi:uncharacterized protein YndB with AHSA1/START domain
MIAAPKECHPTDAKRMLASLVGSTTDISAASRDPRTLQFVGHDRGVTGENAPALLTVPMFPTMAGRTNPVGRTPHRTSRVKLFGNCVMAKKIIAKKINGIGDEAVQEKTGKSWTEWFAILDSAGAKEMSHKEIAAYLKSEQKCPPWWGQMVTVGYEQERGLRDKHQKPDGYSVSASKTVAVPVATLYEAWTDATIRERWLPGAELEIRKATPAKSLRITWGDGTTSVSVLFYAKGAEKSQVAIEHDKLPDQKDVARLKTYWSEALDRLKTAVES